MELQGDPLPDCVCRGEGSRGTIGLTMYFSKIQILTFHIVHGGHYILRQHTPPRLSVGHAAPFNDNDQRRHIKVVRYILQMPFVVFSNPEGSSCSRLSL
jgi:hypothetical protein